MKKKFSRQPLFAAVLCIGILLFLSCGKRSRLEAQGMNVLVITLDTMRADRLGAYGYEKAETPHLDRLAREGVRFENCYTPVPLTLPAHVSLFTGRYPIAHGVRDNGAFFLDERENTLAEAMGQEGYETFAVVASFVLMAKFGLNQGFAIYDDTLRPDELLHDFYSEIPADAVYAKFRRWLDKRTPRRFFAWVHFYDPHAPYEPPEAYRRGESLRDLYDGEVAYTDVFVGKIIQDLADKGLIQDTLIVVVGDHGEAFGEHQEYGHSVFCYEENLKVPLILSNLRLFPQPRVITPRVNLIDIMPTLLELFGIRVPPGVRGRSVLGMLGGRSEKKARTFYIESMYGRESLGWAPLTGLIDGPYKYISLPEPELYDLANDPKEQRNLFAGRKDLAQAMDRKLQGIILEFSQTQSGERRRKMSEEDRERLASLGYVSSFSGKKGSGLDPKKGILLQAAFNSVNTEIEKGHLDEALAALQKIGAENPGVPMPQYYELMAKVYGLKGDDRAVIQTWREGVAAFPGHTPFRVTLGFKLLEMGARKEAEAQAHEIVRRDPKSSRGYILLGNIAEQKHQMEDALSFFEKALALEPNNVLLKISTARSLMRLRRRDQALAICQDILADETLGSGASASAIRAKVGVMLAEMDLLNRAQDVLLEAADQDPANAEAWNGLGVVHYKKRQYPDALEAYRRAVALDPRLASAHSNLGALYLRMALEKRDPRLMKEALRSFDRAIAENPALASAYNGRASAHAFNNRPEQAIRDWKKALEFNPGFVEVYFNLGIMYLRTGRKAEARKILETCREKFFETLPPEEQGRLERLIAEASE